MPVKLPEVPLSLLGQYRMVACVGKGARGVVYQAEDVQTGLLVAIKFMGLPEDMDQTEALQRFEREASTLSQFQHPNIVGYRGSGKMNWDGQEVPYLAMEFLPSLRSLDVAARHYHREWVLDRIEELLGALDYMHTHRDPVIHRDLKPANLGVPADGRLRVLDLGLARVKMSELTNQGAAMGSLGYMAPEQLMDAKKVDHRADIYSVGMILLELLGGHPLRNMTSGRTVKAVISGHIPPTPEPIPEPLDRLARWFCSLSARERPASAAAALRELRGVRLRSRNTAPPQDDAVAAGSGGWETSIRYLGKQLNQARNGDGGTILVCGRSLQDRRMLLDATTRQAEMIGTRVLMVASSRELAQRLNMVGDAQALFERLAEDAEDTPIFVAIPDIPAGDPVLEQLLHMGVRSGEPILMVAATQYAPEDPGRVTVLPLQ